MKRTERMLLSMLSAVIILSMAVTEGLLLLEGRWREALPLHLCSISAIASAVLALIPNPFLLDFLWYLGMPGAAMAILFPAPASAIHQNLMNISYFATHILILLIPACCVACGMCPRSGRTPRIMGVLLGIAVAAHAVNGILGTDYLFLSLPPSGTPLETVFHLGYPAYRLTLFMLMLLCCMLMDGLAESCCKCICK